MTEDANKNRWIAISRARVPPSLRITSAPVSTTRSQRTAYCRTARITKMTESSTPNHHLVPHQYKNHGESDVRHEHKQNV
ncbi:hypothetical protein [Acidibrevibacterium fodinaquatile]|uniref:hypothetical protein n=1 Tax=Acidibrevibacterium fodinaquatile TaxID=1969806 RepID=UPI0013B430E6|nr:hypothetical protein [Acidibrevibacterium fodinaquatile]